MISVIYSSLKSVGSLPPSEKSTYLREESPKKTKFLSTFHDLPKGEGEGGLRVLLLFFFKTNSKILFLRFLVHPVVVEVNTEG